MSRVRMASDTFGIYFTYLKVNHLLYTCPLDPFEDGILLDIPLVCIHRYCRSFMDDEEECKSQGSPTSSVREAWKRRWKKTKLQQSYNHRTSGHPQTRRPKELQPDDLRTSDKSQPLDVRCLPDIRCHLSRRKLSEVRRPPDVRTPASDRIFGNHRTSDPACAQPGLWPCIPLPLTPSWLRLYILLPHP